MTHAQNIVNVRSLSSKEDLEVMLTKVVQQLDASPIQSGHIADAGQNIAANILTADNLTRYWYRLLLAYAASKWN